MTYLRPLLFIALLVSPLISLAETLKSEAEARQLADRIMAQAAKGNLSEAFNLMRPYVIIPEAELQSAALQSKAQRDQFSNRYGKSIGYEFITEKRAGTSLLQLIYIEKTAKHALPWNFYFYKSPSGWVLNSFFWNDQLPSVFPH